MLKLIVTKGSLTTGLVILAAGLPSAAQARPDLNPEPGPSAAPAAALAAAPHGPAVTLSPGKAGAGSSNGTPVETAQPGFQWGDAGIGAGGVLVVLGAGAGAAGVARRRRGHRPVTS
jgi:hypothetical protein